MHAPDWLRDVRSCREWREARAAQEAGENRLHYARRWVAGEPSVAHAAFDDCGSGTASVDAGRHRQDVLGARSARGGWLATLATTRATAS